MIQSQVGRESVDDLSFCLDTVKVGQNLVQVTYQCLNVFYYEPLSVGQYSTSLHYFVVEWQNFQCLGKSNHILLLNFEDGIKEN